MFDVSFSELILIGVIALIVIGPERLPTVARTVGHLLGRAQRYVNDVKSDIQREMEKNDIGDLKNQLEDAAKSVKDSVADAGNSLREPITEAQDALKSASEAVSASAKALAAETPSQPEAAQVAAPQSAQAEAIAAEATGAAAIDPHTLPLPGFDEARAPEASTGKPSTGTHS
ncbi:MAG TPA: Sec-independent protein translocase protein TatB [Eoetvoesiella sp.]|uniref:Sec-independent protein translocase protein TatB n=1 Tax=Eoetvoesiella sp. TaxID=1966355 RepID=UPI002CE8668C|nr:Sec-independent protein translocase protein TatB [Eoetvoesiella sp.]HWK59793.1 Sec-independent protein translocase protein TatB [Eoetvoesiella sp.]